MDFELLDLPSAHDTHVARPFESPPSKSASYFDRADWSARYVTWFLQQIDVDGPARADVGPTHLYQVEFYSCLLDPKLYEQQTQGELVTAAVLH